jgi:hypothetical protein
METIFQRSDHVGLFYSWGRGSSDATLLGANLVGILFIVGFVITIMLPFFLVLNYLGWFRADPLEEILGLDIHYRGRADGEEAITAVQHSTTNGRHLHLAALKKQLKERYRFEGAADVLGGEKLGPIEETVTTDET